MKYEFWSINILSLGFLVTKEFTILIDVLLTCHLYSFSQVRDRYKILFFVGSGRSGNAVLGKKRVSEKAFVSNGIVLKARKNRAPAFLSINFKMRVNSGPQQPVICRRNSKVYRFNNNFGGPLVGRWKDRRLKEGAGHKEKVRMASDRGGVAKELAVEVPGNAKQTTTVFPGLLVAANYFFYYHFTIGIMNNDVSELANNVMSKSSFHSHRHAFRPAFEEQLLSMTDLANRINKFPIPFDHDTVQKQFSQPIDYALQHQVDELDDGELGRPAVSVLTSSKRRDNLDNQKPYCRLLIQLAHILVPNAEASNDSLAWLPEHSAFIAAFFLCHLLMIICFQLYHLLLYWTTSTSTWRKCMKQDANGPPAASEEPREGDIIFLVPEESPGSLWSDDDRNEGYHDLSTGLSPAQRIVNPWRRENIPVFTSSLDRSSQSSNQTSPPQEPRTKEPITAKEGQFGKSWNPNSDSSNICKVYAVLTRILEWYIRRFSVVYL
ncbi:hypothetical protein EV359DRAFT_66144 [Lentinula novae-zelandiae]|nr:hypothetical protein EV359DRAFT_66144 [Lentinula novae-zelandiae]